MTDARRFTPARLRAVVLGVICVVAVGVRAYHLDVPPAEKAGAGYVFDERFYVPAALSIAGKRTVVGDAFQAGAPLGADPNGQHPQLGKLIIAGGIVALGDNAVGWRITALLFGTLSLFLLYWLVRCVGGGAWLAIGTVALASVESLWLVSSRIAMLDILVLPFLLAGVACYLRRQPIVAGLLLGIGCTIKGFAVFGLLIVLFYELARPDNGRLRRLRGTAVTILVTAATALTLLTVLDRLVPPYSGGDRVDRHQSSACDYLLLWKPACNHLVFMNDFAADVREADPRPAAAASPLEFWLGRQPITYYRRTQVVVSGEVPQSRTVISIRGEINRVLLFTSWAAIGLAFLLAIRRRDQISILVLAWLAGTWLPLELANAIDSRRTFLYYMVVVMPALYLATARLLSSRVPRPVVVAWAALFLVAAVNLYPVTG